MNVSLYQAAAALEGTQQRQNVIAANLAAANNPGFKRHNVGFHSVSAAMFNDAMQAADKTQLQFMLPKMVGYINFDQGSLVRTGDINSLAIDGPGFFGITGPNNETIYTRNGSFQVNAAGQLMTNDGYLMRLAGGGGPITVATDTASPVTVSSDGMVSQGGASLGKIEIMNFEEKDLKILKRIGGGYFSPNGATPIPTDPEQTRIAQGFLESSNTTPMVEMGELMTSLRHFEANQKIMKIHDEQMGKLIRELGNTQ